MRLSVTTGSFVLLLVTAMPLVAADSPNGCEKDVLVYVDVSNSMRELRSGGISRLTIFTRAIDDLLSNTSDFLGAGDRVRLVTFAGKPDAVFDNLISAGALPRLSRELNQLRILRADRNDADGNATDVTLVLADLEAQVTAGRRTYVIIASDLIHDPAGENALNQPARTEAFLQRLAEFKQNVAPGAITETIILDANVAGDVDAAVGKEITSALAAAPLNAESIRVTGVSAVTQQLKRRIGNPMNAAVVLRSENGQLRLALRITNPNAFPVRLLQTKVGDTDTPLNRLIACGATETIDIDASAGAQITARFDVGDVQPATVPRDVLEIDAKRARVLLAGTEKGTLLLHVNVRKFLADDAKVDVEVAGQIRQTVSISKGVADGPVTFAIPLPVNAPELRAEETVHARFSVRDDVDLQNGAGSGGRRSVEDQAKTEADARDRFPFVFRLIAFFLVSALVPAAGIARRIFDAALDADLPDLLPGPSRYASAAYAATYPFLPTYLLSGSRWTAFVNALPAAVLGAVFVFYLLRYGSLFFWARRIEPKGVVLPAQTARERLHQLTVSVWIFTIIAFIAVDLTIASLVPYALVAAE
jgi:hypothetical protein